ncbi:hypothetical protein MLD38_002011 [Melastoma candidum]|uniref:Uncharacterized protein n=1 Tax=Melastoma candidum TaxID=119954 RepID=A0ACB9SFH9_9MYRT|nr:hypothetical protein MLD38_002011 [Melastoma candidum]
MSPPLVGVGEEECQSNVTLPSSSTSLKASSQNLELHEHNYMGLFDCPSMKGSTAPAAFGNCNSSLNLRATELRLGLPGSLSPERVVDLSTPNTGEPDEKLLFPLHPLNNIHSGYKRGFADAMKANEVSELKGKFMANSDVNAMLSPKPGANIGQKAKPGLEGLGPMLGRGKEVSTLPECPSSGAKESRAAKNSGSAPAFKAQVVGWPPIRSYRKNSLVATSKNAEEMDGKAGAIFLKVSMDGAPYLRKVDLKNYDTYQELSSALEKMFSCFIIGLYGSNGTVGKEKKGDMPKDAADGTDYVLTYEDKDGDWMLVGDVPWEMFLETCRKLRIMKSSDAIGLAPRAAEKCKIKN